MIAWPGCATQQYAAVVFMWLPLIVARWVRLLQLILPFYIVCPYRAEVADTAVCTPDRARCQNRGGKSQTDRP